MNAEPNPTVTPPSDLVTSAESTDAPLPRRRKLVRYLVNTGLSFVVNLGLTALLHEVFEVREAMAYAVALVTVFVMNFILFRYYVFDGRTDRPARQLGAFAATSVVFRSGEWVAFRLLTEAPFFHELNERYAFYYLLVIIAVQGTTFVIKYFVYGGWLFKRRDIAPAPSTDPTAAAHTSPPGIR